MNQIYLGQRAHGFAAAAEIYFGKTLKDVTMAEAAMLAGLPKAPSAYNPIVNPQARHAAPALHHRPHVRDRLHHRGPARRGAGAGAALPHAVRSRRARRVRCRDGAPAGLRAVRRRGLHARPQRPPDGRRRRAGGGLPRAAPGPDGLRAAPGLPRPRGLCRPAGRPGAGRRARRRGPGRPPRQRRPACGRRARGLAAQGRRDAAVGRRPSPSPATA